MYPYENITVGTFWKGEINVYKIISLYPSIGGTTRAQYVLHNLRTGEEYIANVNEMGYDRLIEIGEEDVPMALLGAS